MLITSFSKLRALSSEFWFLNLIQMFERLAYASVVLQMAVYISQKDLYGGLQWEHSTKGWIFFLWALIQNITPVFLGGLADKYGRKRTLVMATIISAIGFISIGVFRDLLFFSLSTLILGFGLGLFKPAIQGLLANSMSREQKSYGWSVNVLLVNFAVFFAPPLAKYLESISWFWVFAGSALVISFNFLLISLIKNKKNLSDDKFENNVIKEAFHELINPRILYFLLIMSGFSMIYMQFYETLPNFIYDWVDTSKVAGLLHLPNFMLTMGDRGIMIDFKWLYNLNSGLIVLFVVPISFFLLRFSINKAITAGLILVSIGLVMSGFSQFGSITMGGMIIYTFGEMITNPKIYQYMSIIGNDKKRSLYMGFINVSFGIGLAFGSILGGQLYKNLGEKSSIALQFVEKNYPGIRNLNHQNVIDFIMKNKNMSNSEVTDMLFKAYNPELVWLPFLLIGIVSIISLYFYNKKFKKNI